MNQSVVVDSASNRSAPLPVLPETQPSLRDPRFGAFPLSLGHDVLAAHGIHNEERPIIFAHNYTSAELHSASGRYYPPNLTPYPETDYAVGFVAASTTRPGEIALTLPLQPGMERYLRLRGVLAEQAQLLEVNPDVASDQEMPADHKQKLGWPFTDIVTQAAAQTNLEDKNAYFVASLPTTHVNQLAKIMGTETFQMSHATETNNKVRFQEDSQHHGYSVIRGEILRHASQIAECAEKLHSASGVWVKHANAAGGDAVIPIQGPITESKLLDAYTRLTQLEVLTAEVTNFSSESFDLVPRNFVVQLDASTDPTDLSLRRKVHVIGGCLFQILQGGECRIHSYHEQNTDAAGVFYGSQPYFPSPAIKRLIDQQAQLVAQYGAEKLRLFGNVGIDLVVVEDSAGQISVELLEFNGRPTAVTLSRIIAETVQAPCWQQVSIKISGTLNSFEEIAELLGAETLFGGNDGPQFVPIGLSSLYRIEANGDRTLLISSNSAKLLVIGENNEQVNAGLAHLRSLGIEF